ncbi:uncharacterized protein LOC144790838 [Lissotriton helveticus]
MDIQCLLEDLVEKNGKLLSDKKLDPSQIFGAFNGFCHTIKGFLTTDTKVKQDRPKICSEMQLSRGKTYFYCPALNEEGAYCGKELKLALTRSAARYTAEELMSLVAFEEKLAKMAANQCSPSTECPGCRSKLERRDQSSMRVFCTICKEKKGSNYEFCWQCLRPWKGESKSSVGCGNKECKDSNLVILQKCKVIDMPDSDLKGCPSIRACPTCGLLIEHIDMCKYMTCFRCGVEFCFACLKTAQACEILMPEFNYVTCAMPFAPRQTAMPVWSGAT